MQIWIQNPSFSVNNRDCTAAEPKPARVAPGSTNPSGAHNGAADPELLQQLRIFPPSHTEHWESAQNSCSPAWPAASCADGKHFPLWPQFFPVSNVSNLGSGKVICIYKPDVSHWEFHTDRDLCPPSEKQLQVHSVLNSRVVLWLPSVIN